MSTKRIAAISAAAFLALVVGWMLGPVSAASADSVPYKDPASKGTITLCDANNKEVRSGDLSARPMVAKAISSVPAPKPYDGDLRSALLASFQPRKGVAPSEWSGDQLTTVTRYDKPAVPTVVTTPVDQSMGDFAVTFPPQWDGLLQLRMYFGLPNKPIYNADYPTADIRIEGKKWTMVRGGGGDCASGTGRSELTILQEKGLLPADVVAALNGASPSAAAPAGGTPAAEPSPGSPTGEAPSDAAGGDASLAAAEVAADDSTTSFVRVTTWIAAGIAILLLLGAAAWFVAATRSGRPAAAADLGDPDAGGADPEPVAAPRSHRRT